MSPTPPRVRPAALPAPAGLPLPTTLRIPAGDHHLQATWDHAEQGPRAVVLLAPALAVPAGWYGAFAAHLAGRGLSVLRFDYWGFAGSLDGPVSRHPASATDWGADLGAAIRHARARADAAGVPLVLVTHSFGAQALGLTDQGGLLDGLFTVASQLGSLHHWSGWDRLRLELMMRLLVPTLTTGFGHYPRWAGLGAPLPRSMAREWSGWTLRPDFHLSLGAEANYARVTCATRVIAVADDPLAPRGAVAALAQALPAARMEVVHPDDHGLEGLGHFGWFRPPAARLWTELADWVGRTVGSPAPAGTR